jgi:hypothetical protein
MWLLRSDPNFTIDSTSLLASCRASIRRIQREEKEMGSRGRK